MPTNDFVGLLRTLTEQGVDFVLVGGTAAVLHGSSMATYDLDVLMRFTKENCERLLQAVPDKRPLTQTAEELSRFKNLYLQTDLGQLDVLGSLRPIEDIDEVFKDAIQTDVGGLSVRVVSLPHLLRVKEAMGRPKDKFVETELRAIAELLKKG